MGRTYQTSDQVYAVFGELWRRLLLDPAVIAVQGQMPMTVTLHFTDPPAQIVLAPGEVRLGEQPGPTDVEIVLDVETAHRFWTNQLSLGEAVLRGLMKVKGRTAPLMMRLPALLQPGHGIYAELCRAHGIRIEET